MWNKVLYPRRCLSPATVPIRVIYNGAELNAIVYDIFNIMSHFAWLNLSLLSYF